MSRFVIKFLIATLLIIIMVISYLSFVGIETDRFDNIIKKEANKINVNVKLNFKKTKIHINPTELNLTIKLQNPNIEIRKKEIILSKLNLFLPLKSFFTSDFILKKAEVAFYKNNIKDLTKITNLFLPKILNNQLNKVFLGGNLEGEFIIPFKADGKIGEDYSFSGKITNASINITKKLPIKNLTAEINHKKKQNDDIFELLIKNGSIYELSLAKSKIDLKRKKNLIEITSSLHTKGKFNSTELTKLSTFFKLNSNFTDANGTIDLVTKVNFNLNKKFKISNLQHLSEGNIDYLEFKIKENKFINKYIKNFDSKIVLKDSKVRFKNSKTNHDFFIEGMIKKDETFDKIVINESYDYNKKIFDINGEFDLTNSKIEISNLNYVKNTGIKSRLILNIKFVLNKYYNINNLDFTSGDDLINFSKVRLNKDFEVKNFKNLKIKTFKNKLKNNDFLVEKEKNIKISGDIFDAEPLLKSLYDQNDTNTFSKNFNSEVKINFEKVITGTNDDISSFALIASINKRKYTKLNLKGNFSDNEIVEMSIYQIDDNNRTLHVISDRARPFMKNFDFIKGFNGGKLEYESVLSKNETSSNLLLSDFKVSKIPALAKLLTLASLQGIADTLSGEGIRFDSFEMKSNSKDNVLNIEDALAMGPAVSILLSGYVDKGNLVSLRGTLVPATKLNSIIASIPLVGEILVGKKTGEGVVGVSFKMKGPPKDIKTTVNPIKTLTPRFIVRAVEKMKKKKKEKTK